uniref:Uncharacterized protein n=1 Tax=Chenopodium quinoa TaxID=63459 RepID=A0A803NCY8_CHEQI
MNDSPNPDEPIELSDSDSDDEVSYSHQTESKKKTSNVTSLNKPGIHFKRQRKLTLDVWANFEFLDKHDEQEWGIQKKIMCITLENASSNDVFADVIKNELDLYEFVEWAFKKVYGEIEGTNELVKFKERLDYLYGAYVTEASTTTPRTRRRSSRQPNEEQVDVASDSFMMDFDNFSSSKSYVAAKSDLQIYLEEPLIPRATNINILYHWKTNVVSF